VQDKKNTAEDRRPASQPLDMCINVDGRQGMCLLQSQRPHDDSAVHSVQAKRVSCNNFDGRQRMCLLQSQHPHDDRGADFPTRMLAQPSRKLPHCRRSFRICFHSCEVSTYMYIFIYTHQQNVLAQEF
jgi:hypothetical protein